MAPTAEEVEDEPPARPNTAKPKATTSSSGSKPRASTSGSRAASGSSANPFNVESDDDDVEEIPQPTAPSTSSSSRFRNPPGTPSSLKRRRQEPKGVYIGTWNRSGLPASRNNAVYCSRDGLSRINRRISKEDNAGNVVVAGNWESKRTACSLEDVNLIAAFEGLSEQAASDSIARTIDNQSIMQRLNGPRKPPLLVSNVDLTGDSDDDDDDDDAASTGTNDPFAV